MNKSFIKTIILFLSMSFGVLSCQSCQEQTLVIDQIVNCDFSIENLLDENVVISGSVNDTPFSITLSPNESYTYYQDTNSGHVEDGKTPLYLATSIKFSGETVGAVEYSDEFREMWTVEADKHMVFRITKSLFQAE